MPKPNQGQGDNGKSFLFGSGKKFSKDSAQFEALGKLDELNSFVGFARALEGLDSDIDKVLEQIQTDLFSAQANLAIEEGYKKNLDIIPEFTQNKIEFLEKTIEKFEKELPELKNFILPGGTELSARLHICRAYSRTCERAIVAFGGVNPVRDRIWKVSDISKGVNPEVRAYVNRLSDLFFTLARYANHKAKTKDTLWRGKK